VLRLPYVSLQQENTFVLHTYGERARGIHGTMPASASVSECECECECEYEYEYEYECKCECERE
jgi:hypothetical protein